MMIGENPMVGKVHYVLSLHERANTDLYHTVKGRNGVSPEATILELMPRIVESVGRLGTVVIPESSSRFILDVAAQVSDNVLVLPKRSKEAVWEILLGMPLQKAEIERFRQSFDEMGDAFSLNRVKANQRWRFSDIMFDWESLPDIDPADSTILDDSLFTGYTAKFIKDRLGIEKVVVVFSKW